jgi:polyisoprenyl-phosphate glycosyltransferase
MIQTTADSDILISVVSPVYRAELIVDELVRRLTTELGKITDRYEIILVEDCGPDDSWGKIAENCAKDSRVKGIKLSRNFGQHHAITAGLDRTRGQWVVVMDCDLQDQPEEIANLYNKACEGYDIVFARRAQRQDTFIKRMSSKFFYKAFFYLSGIKQDNTIANFGIYSRKVIRVINGMREPMRGFAPMAKWVGFKNTAVDVVHAERFEGNTSYSWSRLFKLGMDIAISYSDKPLKLVIKTGMLISAFSLVYILYTLFNYFTGRITISGFTSLIISIWFLSGLIIFTLGIIGQYIGRTFEGIKNRPIYIVDLELNSVHE